MKLIIVARSKPATFRRLKEMFADDLTVEVVCERRVQNRRQKNGERSLERRQQQRRRLSKPWNGRDYIVIHVANVRKTA